MIEKWESPDAQRAHFDSEEMVEMAEPGDVPRAFAQEQADELRALSDDALAKELTEAYRRLFTLRLQLTTRQQTNTAEKAKVTRQIARVRTVQRERELAAAYAEMGHGR